MQSADKLLVGAFVKGMILVLGLAVVAERSGRRKRKEKTPML